MTTNRVYIEQARECAAQCWCDPDTKDIVMDARLCEAIAERISNWMVEAQRAHGNTQYYRDLVERCGRSIGKPAYEYDDGGISEDVLCAKVPELVEALVKKNS